MDKLYYPATMHPEEDGRYSIWLSDLKGCCSQGNTLAEAVENIKDGLGLYCEEAEEGNLVLPVPSAPDKVPLEAGEFVVIVLTQRISQDPVNQGGQENPVDPCVAEQHGGGTADQFLGGTPVCSCGAAERWTEWVKHSGTRGFSRSRCAC